MARDLLFIVTIGVSARLWRKEVHKMVARGGKCFRCRRSITDGTVGPQQPMPEKHELDFVSRYLMEFVCCLCFKVSGMVTFDT